MPQESTLLTKHTYMPDNMHYGPTGAMHDGGMVNSSMLETGPQFQPKDLDTWEQDSNQVLNVSPQQGPEFINGQKQYPVGNMNRDTN